MSNNKRKMPKKEAFLNHAYFKKQIYRLYCMGHSCGSRESEERTQIIYDTMFDYYKERLPKISKNKFLKLMSEIEYDLFKCPNNSFYENIEAEYKKKCLSLDRVIESHSGENPYFDGDKYSAGIIRGFSLHSYNQLLPKENKWVFEDLIEFGQITGIVASGGIGKTWLGLDLSLSASSFKAENFLSFDKKEECLVFYIGMEDSMFALKERMDSIDPTGSRRESSMQTFHPIAGPEGFDGNFTLVDKSLNGQLNSQYKQLLFDINYYKSDYGDLPVVVIFDTYSATLHGDENTSNISNGWFRAANLLIKHFNAAVIVMHHTRKVGPQEKIRTPEDFKNIIRGSSGFTNSCRKVYGIWPLLKSETKKLSQEKIEIFNFCNIKDNNYVDWTGKDIEAYDRPTITLKRHQNGYLEYDSNINTERKELHAAKQDLSNIEMSELKEHLNEVISFFANSGYPLSRTIFNKQQNYQELLGLKYNKYPPKALKAAMNDLVKSEKLTLTKITINNKLCEIYDLKNGAYANGSLTKRTLNKMPASPYAEDQDKKS